MPTTNQWQLNSFFYFFLRLPAQCPFAEILWSGWFANFLTTGLKWIVHVLHSPCAFFLNPSLSSKCASPGWLTGLGLGLGLGLNPPLPQWVHQSERRRWCGKCLRRFSNGYFVNFHATNDLLAGAKRSQKTKKAIFSHRDFHENVNDWPKAWSSKG